jgi:hypothetical protein
MDQPKHDSTLQLITESDLRLSHLRHPGFKLSGPAYNYAPALAPILMHTPDTVHICEPYHL